MGSKPGLVAKLDGHVGLFESRRQEGLSVAVLGRWRGRLRLYAFDGVWSAAVVVSWIVAGSVRMPGGSRGLFCGETAKKNNFVQRVRGNPVRAWINGAIFGAGDRPAWV